MTKLHNILIVDDSGTTRSMIKRIIGLSGLPIAALYEADNGQAALALLEKVNTARSIDLVLTDLNMPVMDGMELMRRMQASDLLRSIPVLVITAQPSQDLMDELKREGVRGYLSKPFTPEDVRNAVEQALAVPVLSGGHHE